VKNPLSKTRVIFLLNLNTEIAMQDAKDPKNEIDISKSKVKAFSNLELIASSKVCLKKERMSFEHTNWHFQEILERKLFLEFGFDSMAKMLIGHYGFCEFSAFQRVRVLNLVEELPEIADSINSGELSLSNLDKAQSFIKLHEKKNHEVLNSSEKLELIESIKNKTTKEVKEYFARIDPVTSLPPDQIKYLNNTHVQVTWTLEKELLEKLEHLKSLISHENLSPTNSELMSLMLTESIKSLEKKKGIYVKPKSEVRLAEKSKSESKTKSRINVKPEYKFNDVKSSKTALGPRNFSRKAKPIAFAKANRQCEHIHINGKRCTSRFQLQFDHIISFSKGGKSDLDNAQVLCRVHNAYKSNL
jgi:hypothetical protein